MLGQIENRIRRTYTGRFGRLATKGKEIVWQAKDPSRTRARRRAASDLAGRACVEIPREKGFAVFDQAAFGGTQGLVDAGREIIHRHEHAAPATTNRKKEYFFNIIEPADLDRYPAIMEFALNRDLLGSLSRYYGTLPELCSLGLMLSLPNEKELKGSQLAHFDAYDSHHVKVIVAVEDVTAENGALEFIPADKSAEVATKMGARFKANMRCPDDKLFQHLSPEEFIAADVKAGDGVVLDTSTCLHFGSRVKTGRRLMWFIHFAMFSEYSKMEQTANGSILFQNLSTRAKFASERASSLVLAL